MATTNVTIEGGMAFLPNGGCVNLLAIQQALNEVFQETGNTDFANFANELSRVTRKHQGPYGEFLDGSYFDSAEETPNPVQAPQGATQVFQGYFGYEGTQLNVEFQAPVGATVAQKDAAFVAALAQQADIDYRVVGESSTPLVEDREHASGLRPNGSDLECPSCGRCFEMYPGDTEKAGDPCPSDDCPSHEDAAAQRAEQPLSNGRFKLDDRQLATVLASLRFWQREGLLSGGHERSIADDDGKLSPLTAEEIDALCEEINCASPAAPSAIEKRFGADDGAEVLPGATRQEIGEVMMQDIVGDYDVPDQVPEWAWVEKNASYAHTDNGSSGIWEYVLNLSNHWDDIPEKLAATIKQARDNGFAYLIVHQGT